MCNETDLWKLIKLYENDCIPFSRFGQALSTTNGRHRDIIYIHILQEVCSLFRGHFWPQMYLMVRTVHRREIPGVRGECHWKEVLGGSVHLKSQVLGSIHPHRTADDISFMMENPWKVRKINENLNR